jgi:hypothetical protein
MERVESRKYKWGPNSSNFLCWCERRVKECPEEGGKETNFSENEEKHT